MDYTNYDFETCPTRVHPLGPYDKEDVVAAIAVSKGNYAHIGRLLGRKRSKVRDYILSKPELVAMMDEAKEALVDDVESAVFASALAGDGASQRFVLSTLGKDRGYSTRVENTGKDGGPIVTIDNTMTLEEAAQAYADSTNL